MALPRLDSMLHIALRAYLAGALTHAAARMIAGMVEAWRMRRALRDVPEIRAPKTRLFGHLPDMIRNLKRAHDWRVDITQNLPVSKYLGPVWSRDEIILVVKDPRCVQHFLKDAFDKYSKSDPERDLPIYYLTAFLGKGIFTTLHGAGSADGGKTWSSQRKTAAAIFSRANFNNQMREVFLAKAKRLSSLLFEGQKTDMQLNFFNFTMDSVMKIFFGQDSDQVGGEDNSYGTAFDDGHQAFFDFALRTLPLYALIEHLPWPFGGHGLALRLVERLSPVHRKFRAAQAVLDAESRRLVEECRSDPNLNARSDLLALFVHAEADGAKRFTTEELRDTVLNFIIAGRDTTACALSWMFYILATHPDLQRRVAEEVDRTHPEGRDPTLQSVKPDAVPLLHGLLYETLRLYPPVPFDLKQCYTEDVLPDGTPVPVGTKMIFMPYVMGKDPERYPEPEVVRPERWIPWKDKAPNQYEFPVFQAGPRLCLGIEMAVFEAKLAAVVLLRDWAFELVAGEAEKIHYSMKLTMSICNSKEQDSEQLWLIPRRRR